MQLGRPPSPSSPDRAEVSTMRIDVRRPTCVGARPNLAEMSTTGTTRPRRLITPRMNDGIIGTVVRLRNSMISVTSRIGSAKVSPRSTKLR